MLVVNNVIFKISLTSINLLTNICLFFFFFHLSDGDPSSHHERCPMFQDRKNAAQLVHHIYMYLVRYMYLPRLTKLFAF